MKYYETTYEEYIESVKKYNLHPELGPFMENLPSRISNMGNMIVYGPSGVGKYSQVLWLLKKYSNTNLKYDKKIQIQTDKHDYIYHISDIHYEIDMSHLGCNSKILWNDIFMQIVDIISVKSEKIGLIVCKNFHMIHGELLEIFYSYMQQFSKSNYSSNSPSNCPPIREASEPRRHIKIDSEGLVPDSSRVKGGSGALFNYNIIIHFILITENISFIPNNILNSCQILPIRRPTKEQYKELIDVNMANHMRYKKCVSKPSAFEHYPRWYENICLRDKQADTMMRELPDKSLILNTNVSRSPASVGTTQDGKSPTSIAKEMIDNIECNGIMNIKEIYSFGNIKNGCLPKDVFNIICDNIISEMISPKKISFTNFRDIIYDILIYNLEAVDCLWYILNYCIHTTRRDGEPLLSAEDISNILEKSYWFLKYYNNNYRPIYHLESILFYIIIKIHKYELQPCIGDT